MSDQGYPLRTLISGRLIDVAPVCAPAYPDSTVGLRSLAKHLGVPYEDAGWWWADPVAGYVLVFYALREVKEIFLDEN